MSVDRREPVVRPAPAFFAAWIHAPDQHPDQLTHGVGPGDRVAACGVTTGFQGGAWPTEPWEWSLPMPRCAVCSEAVFGT